MPRINNDDWRRICETVRKTNSKGVGINFGASSYIPQSIPFFPATTILVVFAFAGVGTPRIVAGTPNVHVICHTDTLTAEFGNSANIDQWPPNTKIFTTKSVGNGPLYIWSQ